MTVIIALYLGANENGDCALTANEYSELLYPCSAFVISDVHVHLSPMYAGHGKDNMMNEVHHYYIHAKHIHAV